MDSKRNKSKLSTAIFLLEKNDYYISYDFNSKTGDGSVFISWTKEKFHFQYEAGIFMNEYLDTKLAAPGYATLGLLYASLVSICKDYNYPTKFLVTKIDGNNTHNLFFNQKDDDQSVAFMSLITEVINLGLRPEDVEISKLTELHDGFKVFMEIYFGIANR